MKLIETKTLGTAAASIEFTSIPQTFTDLVVLLSVRTNRASATEDGFLRFNGATTNYSGRFLFGNGSSVSSVTSSTSQIENLVMPAATSTSNTFSNGLIYIPNYTAATAKSVSIDTVTENNATAAFHLIIDGLWNDTSAITSLAITANQTGSMIIGSTISLYGITKGSDGLVTVS
jgi:hypothetical protein